MIIVDGNKQSITINTIEKYSNVLRDSNGDIVFDVNGQYVEISKEQ